MAKAGRADAATKAAATMSLAFIGSFGLFVASGA
jgi:hypothetical protein